MSKKVIIAAGVVFGISILYNVLSFRRLNEYRNDPAPVRENRAAATGVRDFSKPTPRVGESPSLLKEIQALRGELNSFRAELLPTPPPAETARLPEIPASCLEKDPEVSRLFRQLEYEERFWGTLEKLHRVRESLGYEKYRASVISLTQEFLGFADSTGDFGKAALRSSEEATLVLSRWSQDRANEACEKELSRIKSGLCRYLDSSYAHQHFIRLLDRWLVYLLPSEQSGQFNQYARGG